jgi:hypothetical protein
VYSSLSKPPWESLRDKLGDSVAARGACPGNDQTGIAVYLLLEQRVYIRVDVFLANSEFAVISIHAFRTNCRNPSIF